MTCCHQFVDTSDIRQPLCNMHSGPCFFNRGCFCWVGTVWALKKQLHKKQALWLGFTVLQVAEVDFFDKIGLVWVFRCILKYCRCQ